MQSLNRRYVPELDQLRAYAAVLVLFYHSIHSGRSTFGHDEWPKANIFDVLVIEGHTGVALFMIVSGFVLASGTLGRSVNYSSFIYNRILRIFPLMTLVMIYAIYANDNINLQGIMSPFLLLANTQPRLFADGTGLTGTVWTISVEFQFYLIAPFVFRFVNQHGIKYLIGLILLTFILKCLALFPYRNQPDQLSMITYYTIIGRIFQFLVGVALAYFWPFMLRWFSGKRSICAIALGLSILAAAVMSMAVNRGEGIEVWHRWMIVYQEIEALIWAAVVASYLLAQPLATWPRAAKVVNAIGVVSFSIYILHWSIEGDFWAFVSAHGLGPREPGIIVLLGYAMLILAIVLALSCLSYNIVEKPFLSLRRVYVGQREARAIDEAGPEGNAK